jgi:hypothetical protein
MRRHFLRRWQRPLELREEFKQVLACEAIKQALADHAQGMKTNRFGVNLWTEQPFDVRL